MLGADRNAAGAAAESTQSPLMLPRLRGTDEERKRERERESCLAQSSRHRAIPSLAAATTFLSPPDAASVDVTVDT